MIRLAQTHSQERHRQRPPPASIGRLAWCRRGRLVIAPGDKRLVTIPDRGGLIPGIFGARVYQGRRKAKDEKLGKSSMRMLALDKTGVLVPGIHGAQAYPELGQTRDLGLRGTPGHTGPIDVPFEPCSLAASNPRRAPGALACRRDDDASAVVDP